MFYNAYSAWLVEKYGEKVYKLPINLPLSCPNRDGHAGTGGCLYCGSKGAGFESLPAKMSVANQLRRNMDYIGSRYKAKKFIAYFQNFSNTYLPPEQFEAYILQAMLENIVGIDVSTRPDCVAKPYLDILKRVQEQGVDIGLELGLQTVNYHTLKAIGRGHTLAEFIDSALMIRAYGFDVCVHLILDLPQDDVMDVIEAAKILTALGVTGVKLHSLYIAKGSAYETMYEKGEIKLLSPEEYVDRCVAFLRHLSPQITVQRLIGRVPKEDSVIANYDMSWWKIKEMIEDKMRLLGASQGDMCHYLGGSAVKQFLT